MRLGTVRFVGANEAVATVRRREQSALGEMILVLAPDPFTEAGRTLIELRKENWELAVYPVEPGS